MILWPGGREREGREGLAARGYVSEHRIMRLSKFALILPILPILLHRGLAGVQNTTQENAGYGAVSKATTLVSG